ncbi:BcsR/BcsP family cellulose biosynthesis protein [Pseudoalteromonas carrageenovora]|uniref:BcsR/BcsP family cellulose biosynthesis protein n=1 Tax=Pseudoalteromonas TaxID=53246 RepID=UPI00311D6B2F
MHSLTYKDSQTLTSSDIENLALRFGGKREDYIEIVNKQKNIQTINKYALLKEINSELNAAVSSNHSE